MNYPVWELYAAGGGFLIAVIAVVHVYVAHFAVGGGLFLVLLEAKGHRENSPEILRFVRQHTKFFMLLTMVFGSLTGVAIWFVIALISPSVTSTLIHTFVFGFATEWVCFIGEIVALLIYYYTFEKMEGKKHLQMGLLYFLFAWLSLFFINGIIGFMLTPGKWLETGNFWHGLFNPSFWPSLSFRTTLALIITGIFGLFTAVFVNNINVRQKIIKFCALWLLIPLIFLGLSALWYINTLPVDVQEMILNNSPETIIYNKWFYIISLVLFGFGLVMMIKVPIFIQKPLAFILLVLGLFYIGSFEMIREAGRRPFLIYGHTFSNAIRTNAYNDINTQGILKTAKWVRHSDISKANELIAGKDIFKLLCISCHSVNGPMNDILPLTKKYTLFGMDSFLSGMGKINTYMPPFAGTHQERQALAKFIVQELNEKVEQKKPFSQIQKPISIPPFDKEKAEYVLLAWNDLGIHFFSDCSPYFSLLLPGNTLHAQLIRRGELPEVITEDVELTYDIEKGFEAPSTQIPLWNVSNALLGKRLPKDLGLTGNGLKGTMKRSGQENFFYTDLIPVAPYDDKGEFLPYPTIRITAKSPESGAILAKTTATVPVSTELGCKNCHGGTFRKNNIAGISDQTARDILFAHDKNSHTTLLKQAKKGEPKQCQACHKDSFVNKDGNSNLLNLSAAIHGWHAQYLTNRGSEACHQCHPSDAMGATTFFRGQHAEIFDCADCHGFMEDHALSLLKTEKKKKGALKLMTHLKPRKVANIKDINPRKPWVNEPDCLNCHVDFNTPDSDEITAFNKWTENKSDLFQNRLDDMETIRCEACHGSPHAIFPAWNKFGKNRDNIQPTQYNEHSDTIGAKNCKLCHIVDMEDSGHHENQL